MSDFIMLYKMLPGVRITKLHGLDITIECDATPKQVFDAEVALRRDSGQRYELFMERKKDDNKLRVKLAKMRGVGGEA